MQSNSSSLLNQNKIDSDYVMFCIIQSRTADWGSNKYLFVHRFLFGFLFVIYFSLKNNIEEKEYKITNMDKEISGRWEILFSMSTASRGPCKWIMAKEIQFICSRKAAKDRWKEEACVTGIFLRTNLWGRAWLTCLWEGRWTSRSSSRL